MTSASPPWPRRKPSSKARSAAAIARPWWTRWRPSSILQGYLDGRKLAEAGAHEPTAYVRRFLLALLLLLALLAGAFYAQIRDAERGKDRAPQVLVVEPGDSVRAIGQRLQSLGLVSHPELFRALVIARGDAGRLRAGEYALEGRLSLEQIVDKLVRGEVVRRTLSPCPGLVHRGHRAPWRWPRAWTGRPLRAAASDPKPIHDLDPEAGNLEGYLVPRHVRDQRAQPGAAGVPGASACSSASAR